MGLIHLLGADVGNPAIAGSFKEDFGKVEITAAGADIWGNYDQFHFVYQEVMGDFQMTVRLEAFSKADLYSKAGIMARETLDPGSKHVFLLSFPDDDLRNHNNGGVEFQFREYDHGDCVAIYPQDESALPPVYSVNLPNAWLRLERNGDNFEALFSDDGVEWETYTTKELKLSEKVLVGLAVTSHNPNNTVTARFSEIEL